MSYVEPGRWSCPACGRGVTVYGSDPDCLAAIRACQQRHATKHRAADRILHTDEPRHPGRNAGDVDKAGRRRPPRPRRGIA